MYIEGFCASAAGGTGWVPVCACPSGAKGASGAKRTPAAMAVARVGDGGSVSVTPTFPSSAGDLSTG